MIFNREFEEVEGIAATQQARSITQPKGSRLALKRLKTLRRYYYRDYCMMTQARIGSRSWLLVGTDMTHFLVNSHI